MYKPKLVPLLALTLAAVIAIFAATLAIKHAKPSDSAIAFTVNGEPVTVREFRSRLNYDHVAQTYSYFKTKYGADAGRDFWTSVYGGEQPIRYVREATLKDEIRIKVQQLLMKRNGIVGDVSYDAFLKQLSDENRSRQEAEAKGKVVFGPKQFGEQDYFDYQMSNNVNKLKEKLFAEAGQVPDADLKARYDSDKDRLYKLPDSIRLEAIRIPVGDNGTDKEQAERQIGSALKMLGTGEAFETVAERFDPGGKAEALVMDETTARNDELAHPDLKAAADILKPGEISGVIAGNGEFAIIRCVEKVRNRYRPFDEVKPNVRSDYINAKYDEQIDKLVREAKVQIDTGVYDKILP